MIVNNINNKQQTFGRLRGVTFINDFAPSKNEKFFEVLDCFKDSKFFDEFSKQYDTRAVFSHEFDGKTDLFTTRLFLYYKDLSTKANDFTNDAWGRVQVAINAFREDEAISMLAKKIRLINHSNAKNWISVDDEFEFYNTHFSELSSVSRVKKSNQKSAVNDRLDKFLKVILLK